jgi:hypothetical protein
MHCPFTSDTRLSVSVILMASQVRPSSGPRLKIEYVDALGFCWSSLMNPGS